MPMTPKEIVKLLKKNGFEEIGQNGSHVKLKNSETKKNRNRSLSLQRPEKGNGAGDIEAGRVEITLPTWKRRYHV